MKNVIKVIAMLILSVVSLTIQAQSNACFNTATSGQSVDFISDSDPNMTYSWDFGDGSTAVGGSPTHTYSDSDSNSLQLVMMVATATNGTKDTITKNVIVLADSDTVVSGVDGIFDNEQLAITTYPNPIVDMLFINVNNEDVYDGLNMKITDMSGRVIVSNTIYSNTEVDVSMLNTGIYVLSLSSENKHFIKKILKR